MVNGQEILAALPNDLSSLLGWVILSFKIFLGLVGIYFVFWLVNLVINSKKNKLLKEILQNLQEINKKISKSSIDEIKLKNKK